MGWRWWRALLSRWLWNLVHCQRSGYPIQKPCTLCVSGICLVTDTQWTLSWCILDHVANSDRDENQLTTRSHFDAGMIHVTFRHVLLLLLLQSSGDKSSWIGAHMFRLMRRREQNDPQYPSHNPTHCMTFAVWESIWKWKPLSLFNKHVHLMYFDPLGSIVPAGEFDLSVACNFFSCEISILYWHLVGLSASSWWHSFLCVLSHLFAFFDILSFAGQTLINSGNRPTHGRRARQFGILLTRTFLSTRSFYLMTPWNFLFLFFYFFLKYYLFFFCSLAVNIRMFLYFSFPFCSIEESFVIFLAFFLSFIALLPFSVCSSLLLSYHFSLRSQVYSIRWHDLLLPHFRTMGKPGLD